MELAAEQNAIVFNLGKEIVDTTPISPEVVEDMFYAKWVSGDPCVTADINSAILVKDSAFDVRQLSVVVDMLHKSKAASSIDVLEASDKLVVQQNAPTGTAPGAPPPPPSSSSRPPPP